MELVSSPVKAIQKLKFVTFEPDPYVWSPLHTRIQREPGLFVGYAGAVVFLLRLEHDSTVYLKYSTLMALRSLRDDYDNTFAWAGLVSLGFISGADEARHAAHKKRCQRGYDEFITCCHWNGRGLTESVKDDFSYSYPYLSDRHKENAARRSMAGGITLPVTVSV